MNDTPNKNIDIFATFSGEPVPERDEIPVAPRPSAPSNIAAPGSSGDMFATFSEEAPPEEDEESLGLQRGCHLGGNLELIEAIGRGGMGEVWLANEKDKSQKFLRQVVAKIVPKDVQNASEEMERVQESFHVVQALQHAHICPLYRMDKDEQVGYFLVMKHIVGQNLSSFAKDYKRRNKKQPPIDVLLPMLTETADALDYAHGKGVIHRDVKPQNILYGAEDGAQLIDFGLAATIRTSMVNVSRVATPVSGTIIYMPPEQLRGKYQDERSDQYAFAATVYELLTGRPPFLSDNYDILKDCILNESAEPIPGVPSSVNKALARALAKNREERFESCTEFVKALRGQGAISTDVSNVANRLVGESKGIVLTLREQTRRFVEANFPASVALLFVLTGLLGFLAWPLVSASPRTTTSSNNAEPRAASQTEIRKTAATLPLESESKSESESAAAEPPKRLAEYLAMLAPGKKYMADWFNVNTSGKFVMSIDRLDDNSGKFRGFFFDSEEPSKTYPFMGELDMTLETPLPISLSTSGTSLDYRDTPRLTGLKNIIGGKMQLAREKGVFVLYKNYKTAGQIKWHLVPVTDESHRKILQTEYFQAGKCYVAEWQGWGTVSGSNSYSRVSARSGGFRGLLGMFIETSDEKNQTFSGVLFDPEEMEWKKKFEGKADSSDAVMTLTTWKINALAGEGWVSPPQKQGENGLLPSTKRMFLERNASFVLTLTISDNKLIYSGPLPNVPPDYAPVEASMEFKEIAPPRPLSLPSSSEQIKTEGKGAENTEQDRKNTETTTASREKSPGANISFYKNIFEAAQKGTVGDVRYFVENGTDVTIKDDNNNRWTALHFAAHYNSKADVLKYLIDNGADVDAKAADDMTPLHAGAASRASDIDVLKCLIDNGANVNAKDKSGRTPLHIVAGGDSGNSRTNVLRLLIDSGANVNAKDDLGGTPLHAMAAGDSQTNDLGYLIDKGADVHAKDNTGATPLHQAAKSNKTFSTDILKFLLVKKAGCNVKTNDGKTPFDVANMGRKQDILRQAGGKSGKELK